MQRKNTAVARELEAELYRLMVKRVKEYAFIVLTPKGKFSSWSPSAQTMFGYKEKEALGQDFSLIFPPEEKEKGTPMKELKEATLRGEAANDGWRMRKDGSRLWASGSLTSLKDAEGELRGFVKVIRDNTERKASEERIEAARRAAEAANEAKDQFLAIVSHELRTPLSTILLWSQMVNGGFCSKDQLKEAMETIQWSAESQKKLIEDLLDTSRIASGKLRLNKREVDPVAILRSAMKSNKPPAQAKNIQVSEKVTGNGGMVHADPDRLAQIISNLVGNAVKFTPEGGKVEVSLVQKPNEIQFKVKDTGRGIAPEFMPHLFTRFTQMENPHTRSHGGLGLGLSIAKQLTELHGGTIDAASKGVGQGATFTVRLPLNVMQAPDDAKKNRPAFAPTEKLFAGNHILLVEDDPPTRFAVTAALVKMGASVSASDSAKSGFREYKKQTPKLIISDIAMPDGDGYAFMRQIRTYERKQRSKRVPAIALTAFTREDDRKRASDSGFDAHVGKPVDFNKLIHEVKELLPPMKKRKKPLA